MSIKTVIGQMCVQTGRSLLNLGGMTSELAGRMIQAAPNLADIGVKILQIADFNINFGPEDEKLLREANKQRAQARRQIGIASDSAQAKQFELDQKFGQDQCYVQQLAGNYSNYAAAQAMMGAGEGMAKGGGNTNVVSGSGTCVTCNGCGAGGTSTGVGSGSGGCGSAGGCAATGCSGSGCTCSGCGAGGCGCGGACEGVGVATGAAGAGAPHPAGDRAGQHRHRLAADRNGHGRARLRD
jgi:hypothetical protein